jgi:GT2 family glycosyltransferase
MPKKTAIIIVNWNSFNHCNNCIRSIKNSVEKDYDIIVVDNGSADNSGKLLKEEFTDIILIESPINSGFSGGNNLGLIYSIKNKYTYSFLLNNDTFVEPDFLVHLVRYMDTHIEAGAIQPKIFFHTKRNILWNGGSIYNKIFGITYSKRYLRKEGLQQKKIQEVDWITGCGFFAKNKVLEEVGILAENMFIYFEDVDLSLRIKQNGSKLVFHPESIIYHIAGSSFKNKEKTKEGYSNPNVFYLNFRNRIWFLKRYTPFYYIPTVLLYNFIYFSAFLFYFLVRRRFQKFNAVLRAIKDGFIGKIQY